jgi:hypothetical protein
MAVHPYVTFRGVEAHLDCQFTLTHGIAPSQMQLRIPPTPSIEQGGTLALNFGGTQITFPQCRVDRVDAARNADGLMVWTLTILDRRWKWKECGKISGYYNVREGENENAAAGIPKQIKKGTEKNLRALMKLCLEAMGEKGFNISKVPDDVFPRSNGITRCRRKAWPSWQTRLAFGSFTTGGRIAWSCGPTARGRS